MRSESCVTFRSKRLPGVETRRRAAARRPFDGTQMTVGDYCRDDDDDGGGGDRRRYKSARADVNARAIRSAASVATTTITTTTIAFDQISRHFLHD